MNQSKEPDPLIEASRLFADGNYESSKKKLEQIKQPNEHIELNILLTEHKINPENSDIVLQALMDNLTKLNYQLLKNYGHLMVKPDKASRNPIKYIHHEFYYWNIIVMAQQIGKLSVSSMVGREALYFSSSFRTKTAFMIIYEMLKQMAFENRLSSCGTIVMKFKEIFQKAQKLTKQEEVYRSINHIMWTKIFLRLGFLEESVHMYMEKLGQREEELFAQNLTGMTVLPFQIYRQFLHAEIQYFKANYKTSLHVLGEIIQKVGKLTKLSKETEQKIRNMAESNIGIIMWNMNKPSIGRKLIFKTNTFFQKQLQNGTDNQRFTTYERSKQLQLYTVLEKIQEGYSSQANFYEHYGRIFSMIKNSDSNKSFKLYYRKGQFCINYFHKVFKDRENPLSYTQIFDNSECTYFYPNQPYFQSKGRNKNPAYQQGKRYYRRFKVPQWDCKGIDQLRRSESIEKYEESPALNVKLSQPNSIAEKDNTTTKSLLTKQIINQKDDKRKRKTSQAIKDKKKQELEQEQHTTQQRSDQKQHASPSALQKDPFQLIFQAIDYFKESLTLLEEEKKVILTFTVQQPQTDLTERVNMYEFIHQLSKIYEDYRVFKQSILMNLCYLYLLTHNWVKVVENAQLYCKFIAYDKEASTFENENIKKAYNQYEYYSVLSYLLQAYCQLNRFGQCYQVLQDLIQLGYSQDVTFQASSDISLNPYSCKIQETNQYHNLLHNITSLHSRDNHIPEQHQALQKILTETNLLPNHSSLKTPLSVNDLLLHYHLRTGDKLSAVEILKRRRVMGMAGVNGMCGVLKVTK